MTINLVGFDSAWADNPRMPGALCAARIEADGGIVFHAPRLVGFEAAAAFVEDLHGDGDLTLVAIDQPTIVPNAGGSRPAERVVASVMSWSGGAIQPANRGKAGMFDDGAPIWRFLDRLSFTDDPEAAARATRGGFVMEVYPALALLSLDPAFAAAGKGGPRYNPARPTFRQEAWGRVIAAAGREAAALRLGAAAAWCDDLDAGGKPRKETQDRLDALLCLLIAKRWREARERCVMVGDRAAGYIVAPVEATVRARLEAAAALRGVPIA